MNFKRHKPRREVRCPHCTPNRMGNSGKAYAIGGGQGPDFQRRRADVDLREELEVIEGTQRDVSCGWWPWDDPGD